MKKSTAGRLIFSFALASSLMLPMFQDTAFAQEPLQDNACKIHFIALDQCSDAIVLESNGKFGIVDSGESEDSPDGSDPRYPIRTGTTVGGGTENQVIPYLEKLGVNSTNLEFYIGTHPHSDHIGSAYEVIERFKPQRVYCPEYKDEYISSEANLWDNLYVYDKLVQAAHDCGSALILNLDEDAPLIPDANQNFLDLMPMQQDGADTLYSIQAPEVMLYSTTEAQQKFGVDPTNTDDPCNTGTVLGDEIPVPVESQNSSTTVKTDSATTGNPHFMLGNMKIDIMNYGQDYKVHPVPDANYFSWGVKVSANGQTAFLSGDINNYQGDEDKLANELGHVNVLKLAHHGGYGSNTPPYLETLNPEIIVQTSHSSAFAAIPNDSFAVIDSLDARILSTGFMRERGYDATVVSLTKSGIETNIDNSETVDYFWRNSSPHVIAYQAGGKTIQKGWARIWSEWYWFDNSPYTTEDSWIKTGENSYRLLSDGAMATGSFLANGIRYIADSSGALIESDGWHAVDGNWYFTDKGIAFMGWLKQGPTWYWLNPNNAAMQAGWASVNGVWYWFETSGSMAYAGWKFIDNEWYYFSVSGAMQTGWVRDGANWYRLAPSGAMQTGWIWDGNNWYYLDPSGAMLRNTWLKSGSSWYYLKDSGAMTTGWIFTGGRWYYLDASGLMQTGWLQLNNTWYWLDGAGAMATGTKIIDGIKYSFNPDGSLR